MIPVPAHAPLWAAAALAVGAATASWRKFTRGSRDLALWLQFPAAVFLYLGLFPPEVSLRSDALTVMTPGAMRSQQDAAPRGIPVIALPGARAPAQAESAPDLATALRRHPTVSHLTIIGGGLSARDRAAVAGRALVFYAAPERGLLELHAPATVPLGRQWALSGRAASNTRRVELLDPSGSVVDKADVDQSSRFALSAAARGTGNVCFELRLLGPDDSLQDTISIPMIIAGGTPIHVIARFGSVNPELKYWRRWTTDAGLDVALSAGLSDGVNVHAGDTRFTAAALSQADVVVIDARAWATLDLSEKTALRDATEDGLGLLLRADVALTAETTADWRGLGFTLTSTVLPASVILDRRLGLRERTPFTAAAVSVSAPGSVVNLKADDGTPLSWWHTQGRGRIALWSLSDSYRLALLGEQERYANLWANTFELLARPRSPAQPPPQLPENAWVVERTVICRIGTGASVRTPNDPWVALAVDADGCAAFWPDTAGWHSLELSGSEWPFYVRAADDGRTLHATLDAVATAAMFTTAPELAHPSSRSAAIHTPMPSWPWLLVWLAVTVVTWWWERRDYALR